MVGGGAHCSAHYRGGCNPRMEENIFVKERQLHLGVSSITCDLHACRHQNESKSRKYLAKVRPEELASARDLPGNL